ncbi:uncharacterized protein LOC115610462 isoform X4 [Strigops habroptila]|uniref:uncharacterized protein LOC115610462 isoform X4 n=1 Tax=Strigops habroptila TaxID=2489341 RepID=UPI0011CFF134|nr:uncharacterized protein LOC115610462 isoform X4 [Strigops habroptila]
MYSPGEGRDESVFNLPAINFNQTPGCCTARTPRLLSASPSPLSPMSTSTTVCFARSSFKPMSDLFLLPCAIAPPFSSYPRWPLLHTLCLSHAVCAPPAPPPFFSFLQCLHMQHLSECAMSFLLGSAASFTVDWFLFRNRAYLEILKTELLRIRSWNQNEICFEHVKYQRFCEIVLKHIHETFHKFRKANT